MVSWLAIFLCVSVNEPYWKKHLLRSTPRFCGRYSEVCQYVTMSPYWWPFFYSQEMATNYGIARQKISFFCALNPLSPQGWEGFFNEPETIESRLFQTEDAIIFPFVFVVSATIIRVFGGNNTTPPPKKMTQPPLCNSSNKSSPRGSYQCGNSFEIRSMQRILIHSDAGM